MKKQTLVTKKIQETQDFINDALMKVSVVTVKVVDDTVPATDFADEYITYKYIDFKIKKCKRRGPRKFKVSQQPVEVNFYSDKAELLISQTISPYISNSNNTYTIVYDEFPPTVKIDI